MRNWAIEIICGSFFFGWLFVAWIFTRIRKNEFGLLSRNIYYGTIPFCVALVAWYSALYAIKNVPVKNRLWFPYGLVMLGVIYGLSMWRYIAWVFSPGGGRFLYIPLYLITHNEKPFGRLPITVECSQPFWRVSKSLVIQSVLVSLLLASPLFIIAYMFCIW